MPDEVNPARAFEPEAGQSFPPHTPQNPAGWSGEPVGENPGGWSGELAGGSSAGWSAGLAGGDPGANEVARRSWAGGPSNEPDSHSEGPATARPVGNRATDAVARGGVGGRHFKGADDKGKHHWSWRGWLLVVAVVAMVVGGGTAWAAATVFKPQPLTYDPLLESVPPSPRPTPTPMPTPTPAPGPVWPLTGVAGDVVQRPALVVKIENSIDARPQEGLDSADIVFEEMVEGGIARYVAIFHSTLPFHVLPVRSIRPMDGPIAGWTKGVIVFAGGKQRFKDIAQQDGLQLISTGSGLGRVDSAAAPHNLAGNPEKLIARADADHQAPPPVFADFAAAGGQGTAGLRGTPASKLTVTISPIAQPRWTWDGTTWLRWENDKPALVVGGQQLSANNVILVSVDVVMQPEVDAIGTHVPESIVTGQGTGLLAGDGKTIPITWSKDSATSQWQFLGDDGKPVTLSPGNTWIELVPNGSGDWSVS